MHYNSFDTLYNRRCNLGDTDVVLCCLIRVSLIIHINMLSVLTNQNISILIFGIHLHEQT